MICIAKMFASSNVILCGVVIFIIGVSSSLLPMSIFISLLLFRLVFLPFVAG